MIKHSAWSADFRSLSKPTDISECQQAVPEQATLSLLTSDNLEVHVLPLCVQLHLENVPESYLRSADSEWLAQVYTQVGGGAKILAGNNASRHEMKDVHLPYHTSSVYCVILS